MQRMQITTTKNISKNHYGHHRHGGFLHVVVAVQCSTHSSSALTCFPRHTSLPAHWEHDDTLLHSWLAGRDACGGKQIKVDEEQAGCCVAATMCIKPHCFFWVSFLLVLIIPLLYFLMLLIPAGALPRKGKISKRPVILLLLQVNNWLTFCGMLILR